MEASGKIAQVETWLPVRIFRGFCSGVRDILGQLTQREFWIKLIQTCAKEMVSAFLKTLGGKFLSYGIQREDPEVKRAAQAANTGTGSTAFSNGYTPRSHEYPRGGGGEFGSTNYRSYPVPVSTGSQDGNFPGFGR